MSPGRMSSEKENENLEATLLPCYENSSQHLRKSKLKDFFFKFYVIISMTLIWTSYTILLRYTRTSASGGQGLYFSTTVVFLAELAKFLISIFFLIRTHNFHLSAAVGEFRNEYLGKPKELLKMSVPSVVYAIQNNFDFVALSNLDAGVYQVTTQLKVVTTVIFMVVMLGRRYSLTRWISILFLFGGVALVQFDAIQQGEGREKKSTKEPKRAEQNYLLGISAVLVTCLTAGFAGVYFEKMLKDGSQIPFWIRNLQLYTSGIVSAGLGCVGTEGKKILENGFFYCYDNKVWIIVGLLSLGGIYISLVMKYLDNLLKSFASSVSIILVCIVSYYLLGSALGLFFVFGSFIVCGSIVLYNSVSE